MQKQLFSVALASLVLVAAATPRNRSSVPADEKWVAQMSGEGALPTPFPGAGNGTAEVTIGANSISWVVTVSGLKSPATMAHIHGPGANPDATVIIPFVPFAQGVKDGQISKGSMAREKLPIPMDSLRKMLAAGVLYVNVHTEEHRSGAIRGTLMPVK